MDFILSSNIPWFATFIPINATIKTAIAAITILIFLINTFLIQRSITIREKITARIPARDCDAKRISIRDTIKTVQPIFAHTFLSANIRPTRIGTIRQT